MSSSLHFATLGCDQPQLESRMLIFGRTPYLNCRPIISMHSMSKGSFQFRFGTRPENSVHSVSDFSYISNQSFQRAQIRSNLRFPCQILILSSTIRRMTTRCARISSFCVRFRISSSTIPLITTRFAAISGFGVRLPDWCVFWWAPVVEDFRAEVSVFRKSTLTYYAVMKARWSYANIRLHEDNQNKTCTWDDVLAFLCKLDDDWVSMILTPGIPWINRSHMAMSISRFAETARLIADIRKDSKSISLTDAGVAWSGSQENRSIGPDRDGYGTCLSLAVWSKMSDE
jgi:hypothetical protein